MRCIRAPNPKTRSVTRLPNREAREAGRGGGGLRPHGTRVTARLAFSTPPLRHRASPRVGGGANLGGCVRSHQMRIHGELPMEEREHCCRNPKLSSPVSVQQESHRVLTIIASLSPTMYRPRVFPCLSAISQRWFSNVLSQTSSFPGEISPRHCFRVPSCWIQ